jgi:hypothetical protein
MALGVRKGSHEAPAPIGQEAQSAADGVSCQEVETLTQVRLKHKERARGFGPALET